jgi:hypothetical protein
MGLKQILQNFSWETIVNLPPSDLLALLVLCAVAVAIAAAGALLLGAVFRALL